ncbi:MAG: hypothetical protein IT305_00195 [Chloroflexi bacterium]|nr:hypothetical protein [Chloroflexota bacterium]
MLLWDVLQAGSWVATIVGVWCVILGLSIMYRVDKAMTRIETALYQGIVEARQRGRAREQRPPVMRAEAARPCVVFRLASTREEFPDAVFGFDFRLTAKNVGQGPAIAVVLAVVHGSSHTGLEATRTGAWPSVLGPDEEVEAVFRADERPDLLAIIQTEASQGRAGTIVAQYRDVLGTVLSSEAPLAFGRRLLGSPTVVLETAGFRIHVEPPDAHSSEPASGAVMPAPAPTAPAP